MRVAMIIDIVIIIIIASIVDEYDNICRWFTPSPPTKSLGFGGFDSSRLLI